MINTFFGVDALGSPAALINAIIIGFVFGWCFEIGRASCRERV